MPADTQSGWATRLLMVLGAAQVVLWTGVALLAQRFAPGSDFGQRPVLAVGGLLAAGFALYLVALAVGWNAPSNARAARAQVWGVLLFALLMRLPLWWSQPIQEIDLYRYLWDGRVLKAGVNPYRYSPAQVDVVRNDSHATPDLRKLVHLLEGSPEVDHIFATIDHRTVPTIYPPLSQAVFAAAASVTPERAPVMVQMGVMKGLLLLFDLATILLVMGLLRNLGLPPARALAYAWCPLVLKEFANTGHLDSIAVCLTTASLWLLTPRKQSPAHATSARPAPRDWAAAVLWAGAVLAKLYPLVLAPVLLAHGWHRFRWRVTGPILVAALVVAGGYLALPRATDPTPNSTGNATDHNSLSGLGEFLRHWEMNDLLFSVVYENVRPRDPAAADLAPWYSVTPLGARDALGRLIHRSANAMGLSLPPARHAFLFTQMLAALTLLAITCALARRTWPPDPRAALPRRAFLSLAWLWFLSATQNPWYWTWALPLVLFASRAWLLVSGFALLYYLRFWFVWAFAEPTLPGGLNGTRFFDEVVVWFEHLPPLLAVMAAAVLARKRTGCLPQPILPRPPSARGSNTMVIIPALDEAASLPGVLRRLHHLGLNRIRVVDNGSRDDTAAVAGASGAEVVREPRRGYGQACWTGCQELPDEVDWILFCNADGSDDLERVPRLITEAAAGADFVLGVRAATAKGRDHLSLPQRWGNKLAVTLIRWLWGARYGDLGPLRLIGRRAFERLRLRDRGFGWTVEMQVRAVEEGLVIHQVPVGNLPRTAGVSKISGTVKGTLQAGTIILSTLATLWWRSTANRPHPVLP